jgi:hypothetical protein
MCAAEECWGAPGEGHCRWKASRQPTAAACHVLLPVERRRRCQGHCCCGCGLGPGEGCTATLVRGALAPWPCLLVLLLLRALARQKNALHSPTQTSPMNQLLVGGWLGLGVGVWKVGQRTQRGAEGLRKVVDERQGGLRQMTCSTLENVRALLM